MAWQRVFTDEQLELWATPLSIRLERATDPLDREEIERIRDQMDMECLAIYDAYVNWVGVLQTFLLHRGGQAMHDEALRWAAEFGLRPAVRRLVELPFRERVEALSRRLRAAGSTFTVDEDAERVRFRLDAWGGATRLWRAPEAWQSEGLPRHRAGDRYRYPSYGAYDPPTSFAWLEGRRAVTQGRDRLPAFFATEVLFLEEMPIELAGAPLAVVTIPETAAGHAVLDVVKDARSLPASIYERVGTVKPAAPLAAEQRARVFSDEELARMGVPLSLQVEAAAAAGDRSQLLEIAAGMDVELVNAKDPLGVVIAGLLSWIARHLGEAAVEDALKDTAQVVMTPFVDAVRGLQIEDSTPLWAMVWRSHGSTFWIEEHEETVVFRGRPLGACHRMWSHAYQPEVERISESRVRYPTFGCYDPPASFHLMREPRGITHGKVGYPVYSCHCHMLHEIFPIDHLGHPLWVELHPIHDRDGETVHIHYKDPAAWPERYYEQVGRAKPDR